MTIGSLYSHHVKDPVGTLETGTNKKITNQIANDSSNVYELARDLKSVYNSTLYIGDGLRMDTQVKDIVGRSEVIDSREKAVDFQKVVRATKQIIKEDIKALRSGKQSFGGKIHEGSSAEKQLNRMTAMYQLTKEMQFNISKKSV